jgi:hypothetical protein
MEEHRWILGHAIGHAIHHRGQMTALRLMDASVPMVYGPTADECNEVPLLRRHLFFCAGPRCTVNGKSEVLFKVVACKREDYGLDQGMNECRATNTL